MRVVYKLGIKALVQRKMYRRTKRYMKVKALEFKYNHWGKSTDEE
jgi:hypothetical protein